MIRVKICGINSAAAMDAACAAGADWIGFVFASSSPRVVSPAHAEELSGRRRGGPLRVGVFVEPDEAQIEAALEAVPLDVLQLHTDAGRAAELRAQFGVAVWRAIGVTVSEDLPIAADGVDGYVLDAAAPAGTPAGGNGVEFDYAVLRGWRSPLPWLLAGGLTPQSVSAAISITGADAVDVSSGVESCRGVKDPERIAAFVAAARGQLTPPAPTLSLPPFRRNSA